MSDPGLELQGAIVQRLKADPAVAALVNGRIYDSVPSGATFPYISYGPEDMLSEDADCITGYAVFVQLDAWSRAPGFPEVKKIRDAVIMALHEQDEALPLPTHALVFIHCRQSTPERDPDGLTSRAMIRIEAYIERQL